jgi:hypothetical protein
VPRGTYVLAGRPEPFSCAPGPAGWRYASGVLDLACDTRFRCVRVQVRLPDGAWVRGGRTVLEDGAPVVAWVGSADPSRERHAAADAVDAPSPGALVALARLVAPPGAGAAERLLTAVRFEPPALGGLTVRLRVSRGGADVHDGLLVERWYVDDLDTGARTQLHLAGDVVLWAVRHGEDGWEVELADLDSPPSPLPPH